MKKPFLFVAVSNRGVEDLSFWSVSEKGAYWKTGRGLNKIYLAKRDSYPKTFIARSRNRSVLALGYIEPDLYPHFKKCLGDTKELSCFIAQLKKELDREFLLIVLTKSPPEIRVYRDALCTVPIFYLEKEHFLLLSNEFVALLPYLAENRQIDLDFKVLSEHLLHLVSLPQRTIFSKIKLLTERSVLIKSARGVRVRYPRPWPVLAKCSELKRPLFAFSKILEETLSKYWGKFKEDEKIGFEISGGVDSITPAGFYAKKSKKPLKAFSMLLPGEEGKSQREKLKKIEEFLGLEVNITPIANLFPLKSQLEACKPKPFYPMREIYFEALEAMAQRAQKEGIKVIITGMGGDEAFIVDPREKVGHKVDFPTPAVPYSVLAANVARNNIYIAYDIWPVAPLAAPRFAMFCRSLPEKLRKDKKILREYQKKRGYPKTIYAPKINENFVSFFESTLRDKTRGLLIELFGRSVLARLGLVKKKQLIRSYLGYTRGKNDINPLYFYAIAVIEILLQSFDEINN